MRKPIYVLLFAAIWVGQASAQSSQESLKEYVPILPSVKAKFWKIDPKVGYVVKNVGGGVYVMSDNGWQSAFLVTDEGVIVFDAPASFGKNIPLEVSKVTDKPIKMLIYSHSHKDHIGGSAAFKNIKDLKIVALEGGHLTDIVTRQDVEITKELTLDVYNTVKRIHNNMDATAATAEAVKAVGPDNEFLLFKVFLDKVADESVKELKPRWINRLAGVDVWLESHVRTAIIYVRWDDKE